MEEDLLQIPAQTGTSQGTLKKPRGFRKPLSVSFQEALHFPGGLFPFFFVHSFVHFANKTSLAAGDPCFFFFSVLS